MRAAWGTVAQSLGTMLQAEAAASHVRRSCCVHGAIVTAMYQVWVLTVAARAAWLTCVGGLAFCMRVYAFERLQQKPMDCNKRHPPPCDWGDPLLQHSYRHQLCIEAIQVQCICSTALPLSLLPAKMLSFAYSPHLRPLQP